MHTVFLRKKKQKQLKYPKKITTNYYLSTVISFQLVQQIHYSPSVQSIVLEFLIHANNPIVPIYFDGCNQTKCSSINFGAQEFLEASNNAAQEIVTHSSLHLVLATFPHAHTHTNPHRHIHIKTWFCCLLQLLRYDGLIFGRHFYRSLVGGFNESSGIFY